MYDYGCDLCVKLVSGFVNCNFIISSKEDNSGMSGSETGPGLNIVTSQNYLPSEPFILK